MADKPQRRPAPRRDPTRTLVLIAALVTVVVVLGLVVVLVVGGDDDGDGEASKATVATTPTGVAICPAPDGSAANREAAPSLPAFPADDVLKPVAVDGDVLPMFTRDMQGGGAPDTALCGDAPVVSGYDYAGNEVTIDPRQDGPTMVVLLAHWCPHCNAEIPVLNEWRDAGEVPEELNIVGVSTAIDPSRPNYPPDDWLDEMDWQWSVLADGVPADERSPQPAFAAYGGTSYPTILLIDSDGRLRARMSGEFPADYIDAVVDDFLTEPASAGTGTTR